MCMHIDFGLILILIDSRDRPERERENLLSARGVVFVEVSVSALDFAVASSPVLFFRVFCGLDTLYVVTHTCIYI